MKRFLLFAATHLVVFAMGFALGVYLLPILAAPPAPTAAELAAAQRNAMYRGEFSRSLAGSDALHWGEGQVTVTRTAVSLQGKLAPGPAYRLYLVPEFVDGPEAFERVRNRSLPVGDIKTFDNFIVPLPAGTPVDQFNTVVVWCESFSRFISSAKYR
ncbi:MAG TPA: DM13 domain-containing protein [Ramlibacter sp.]|jgi:hypothetical protein|nr:DM13 domain-containing protein [Ramlibacter sp.]